MKCPFVIKVCTRCKKILIANERNFSKKKNGKYGLCSRCKKCDKKYREDNKEHIKRYKEEYKKDNPDYNKKYYENNKEEILKRHKEYRENNKEKTIGNCRKWRVNNKEKIKKYNEEYYKNNKKYYEDKRKKWKEDNKGYHKEYHKNNKEREKEYARKWRKNNFDKIFNNCSKRRFKLKNQGRGITKEQWYEMMIFFNFKCAYSDILLNENNRSIDHIVPLDNGGLNEIWNCVPMLRNYNSSKNATDMYTWYKQQEFYSKERLNKIYMWQEYAYNKWGKQLVIKEFIDILKCLINKEE